MTIQSTVGRELSVNDIVRRAYQLAGLMPAEQGTSGPTWAQKASLGRDLLETILDELQVEGVFARSVNFTSVSLTAEVYEYTLPDTVFDCSGDGSYIPASASDLTRADGETPVKQIDRETWQRMSSKAATGRPVMFWVDRSVFPVVVRMWPQPDEAGTVRFQTFRLLADTTDGNATVDLERYWSQYLLWELAHQLASAASQPDGKCMRLAATAKDKLEKCKTYAAQSVPNQIYLDHRTSWSHR